MILLTAGIPGNIYSQCTCTSGAAIGGMTPVSGTTNVGVLQKKNMNTVLFSTFGSGSNYFSGNEKVKNVDVEEMKYAYSSLSAGYGITDKLTVEAEIGYFWDKYQRFIGDQEYNSSGLSHFGLGLKYNLLHSLARKLEFTGGLNFTSPLQFGNENLPQNILPSSGNYGTGIFILFHKGLNKGKSRLMLINRSGITFENSIEYQYGNYSITSGYYVQSIGKKFAAIAEFRSEIRDRDTYEGNTFKDSGGYIFYFTPQVNYSFRNWNFSILADIPIYRYYNGSQLGKSFSVGLNINQEFSFEEQEEEYDDEFWEDE
jgi:hypothetical protein